MLNGIQAYQRNDASLKSKSDRILSETAGTTPTTSQSNAASEQTKGRDKVTLSPAVAAARFREDLGLPATGRINRRTLSAAYAGFQDLVDRTVTNAKASVGIPTDAKIDIQMTEKGDVKIKGSAKGLRKLEKHLNQDATFKRAFSGLSTHSRLDDYAEGRTSLSSTKNLAAIMGDEGGSTDLMGIAREYMALRENQDQLRGLVTTLHQHSDAYTYTHKGEEKAA